MFYEDLYGNFTICKILDLAKNMLSYSSTFINKENDQDHYGYFMLQTRKKISEIMTYVDSPMFNITYDALVHREAYKRYVYNSVSSFNKQPNELNEAREKELAEAEKRMKEVPVDGYKDYAIIKYIMSWRIESINIEKLREVIAGHGKISAFLWYDFDYSKNQDLTFPIITW